MSDLILDLEYEEEMEQERWNEIVELEKEMISYEQHTICS